MKSQSQDKTPLLPAPPTAEQDRFFRKIFYGLIALLVVLLPYLSLDYGANGDDRFQKPYGELSLDYMTSFGKNDSVLRVNLLNTGSLINLYSPVVDMTAAAVYRTLGLQGWAQHQVRHIVIALFGVLIFLGAGLTAAYLGGYRAAVLVVVMLALSPRVVGDLMNNPKDSPFSAAYILSFALVLRFLKELPRPSVKSILLTTFGIGLLIGMRPGGLLMSCYLGLFTLLELWFNRERWLQGGKFNEVMRYLIPAGAFILIVSYFMVVPFWPWAQQKPLTGVIEALSTISNFPISTKALFEGKRIWSNEVPWYYIPTYMLYTVPLFFLIALAASLIVWIQPVFNRRYLSYLLFIVLFAWAYAVYKKSALYGGWRHFYFIYPPLVVLAALGIEQWLRRLPSKAGKAAIGTSLGLGMLLPAVWMVRNHPYQSTYFNEIIGGVDGAYGRFETDYYNNSVKEAAEWLRAHADFSKEVIIATNMAEIVQEHFSDIPNAKVWYQRYGERNNLNWDYAIFNTMLMEPSVYGNKSWFPPKDVIYTVKAENSPLTLVFAHPLRDDYFGAQALKANKFAEAVPFLQSAVKHDPRHELALVNLSLALLNTGRFPEAEQAAAQALQIQPDNLNAMQFAGYACLQSGQPDRALLYFQQQLKVMPEYFSAYRNIAMVFQMKGDQSNANYYMQLFEQFARQAGQGQ